VNKDTQLPTLAVLLPYLVNKGVYNRRRGVERSVESVCLFVRVLKEKRFGYQHQSQ